MNESLKKILVLGGAFNYLPHEMFPTILNVNDAVPVEPKHSHADWNIGSVESHRRHQAAIEKRERRAEKLRKCAIAQMRK